MGTKHAFKVIFAPHDGHGTWLWSIHKGEFLHCVAFQQPNSTGYTTAEAALAAAREHYENMQTVPPKSR